MTDQQHPITPPLALIDQWWDEAKQNAKYDEPIGPLVAAQAAQWGANQELEACCMWITREKSVLMAEELGIARRPKPPSLKEQALSLIPEVCGLPMMRTYSPDELLVLRRALEALPE